MVDLPTQVGNNWDMTNSTYIIEVRRSAEAQNKKFFKSLPSRQGARIGMVTDSKFAKKFQTQTEAEEVLNVLRNGCWLYFTIVEKGV